MNSVTNALNGEYRWVAQMKHIARVHGWDWQLGVPSPDQRKRARAVASSTHYIVTEPNGHWFGVDRQGQPTTTIVGPDADDEPRALT